jgi:hypothetical protein
MALWPTVCKPRKQSEHMAIAAPTTKRESDGTNRELRIRGLRWVRRLIPANKEAPTFCPASAGRSFWGACKKAPTEPGLRLSIRGRPVVTGGGSETTMARFRRSGQFGGPARAATILLPNAVATAARVWVCGRQGTAYLSSLNATGEVSLDPLRWGIPRPGNAIRRMVRFLRRHGCSQGQALTSEALRKPSLH